MAGYLGSTPVPQATQHRESFTCTEGQTSFATAGYTPQFLDVFLNGSHLSPADFVATNGSDVVLVVAASADDVCDIVSYTPFEVANQTFTGTTAVDVATVGGTLGVTGVLTTTAATIFNGGFAANDGSTITTADNSTQLTLISTDADASVGPVLDLFRNTTGASADEIGRIQFTGKNDAGTNHTFAQMYVKISDATSSGNTEDAQWSFDTIVAGTVRERMGIYQSGIIINQEGLNLAFRVESANDPNAFFVEGSTGNIGIGTAAPAGDFHLTDASDIRILFTSDQTGNTSGDGTFIGLTDGGNFNIFNREATNIKMYTSGVERLNIAADGAISTTTAGTNNVRLGANAGDSIVSGANENVLIGDEAGTTLVSGGINNTAVGFSALKFEDAHGYNTAIGWSTLKNLNAGANGYNTAVGADAGRNMSTGVNNTLVGFEAGHDIDTGTGNSYIGVTAGDGSDDGANNVAVGFGALSGNHGNNNVAVGEGAAIAATGGTNTIVGSGAGGNANFSGSSNTMMGRNAGNATTSGVGNQLFGTFAGDLITTGTYNVCLGYDVGSRVNNLTTGSKNILIGYKTSGPTTGSNAIGIGDLVTVSPNDFSFGKASNVVTNDFDADANWSRSSDERLKKNITNQTLGLDFINDLRTVKYNWKPSDELDANDAQLAHLRREDEDGNIINDMNTDVLMHNFIAQEVKAALDTAGVSDFAGWKEDEKGVQQVSREMFVIPLVKAVQELSTALDAALARIATLEG